MKLHEGTRASHECMLTITLEIILRASNTSPCPSLTRHPQVETLQYMGAVRRCEMKMRLVERMEFEIGTLAACSELASTLITAVFIEVCQIETPLDFPALFDSTSC